MIFVVRPLLILAVVGLVGLMLWSALLREYQPVTQAGIAVRNVADEDYRDTVQAQNVNFTGRDQENRPLALTADRVIPLTQDYSVVELEQATADLTTEGNGPLSIQSARGTYDREAELLSLAGDVQFRDQSGLTITTDQAEVNLANRDIASDQDVAGTAELGSWQSEGIRITDNGQRIVLTGRSTVTLTPRSGEQEAVATPDEQ